MAQKIFTSVNEFNATSKDAKSEINGIFKSPFVVINLLNKAAKGDFSKVANCSTLKAENLKKVAKAVKGMHKYSTPFAFNFLLDSGVCVKDFNGRLCYVCKWESQADFAAINNGEIVCNNKGMELVINDGKVYVLRPVILSIIGVYNAFAKVVKNDVKETEKESKKAAKARESKELKAAKARLNNAIRDYNGGIISEIEFCERAKAAKAEINQLTEKAA